MMAAVEERPRFWEGIPKEDYHLAEGKSKYFFPPEKPLRVNQRRGNGGVLGSWRS
jgi:hypothetical protein